MHIQSLAAIRLHKCKKQQMGLAENKKAQSNDCAFCDPAGARTQDPYIKSVMLYQLSYEIKTAFLLKKRVQIYELYSVNKNTFNNLNITC